MAVTRRILAWAIFIAAFLGSRESPAGIYTDDLTRCLVKSFSTDDQVLMIRWIFYAMALNPAIESQTSITTEQRDTMNKNVGGLFERLLTENCNKEATDAIKFEGATTAISGSFSVLGQVAMRGLMSDQKVSSSMKEMAVYANKDGKLPALMKAAGQPDPTAPAK